MAVRQSLAGDPGQIAAKLMANINEVYNHDVAWLDMIMNTPKAEVGPTPRKVIWTKNKSKLYRYFIPGVKPKYSVPILLIYALINKPYIYDFYRNNSVIEFLLHKGFDVYMLDWGSFGWEDRSLSMSELVLDYMHGAVKKVLRFSQAKELSIMGYCMGGTLVAMYLGTKPDIPVRNVIFLAAPFDFGEPGLWGKWLKPENFDIDNLVGTMGLIPPELIRSSAFIDPVKKFVGHFTALWKNIHNKEFVENWLALHRWIMDGVLIPGKFFGEWVKSLYQKNELINNQLTLRGEKVELRNIKANTLVIAGELDIIADVKQVRPVLDVISSEDKHFVVLPLGHWDFPLGRGGHEMFYPLLREWLGARSS